MKHLKYYNSHS